jgi:hypothetical protein
MARTKTESIKMVNTQNTTRRWETTIEQFPLISYVSRPISAY